MARDPVCGMQVDEQMAIATSEYQGQIYYCCAKACKTAFGQAPVNYLAVGDTARRGSAVPDDAPSMAAMMSYRWRRMVVAAVTLGGVVLVLRILGMGGWRELMAIGTVPTEMLGRQVSYTVVSAFLGYTMIVWCLVVGLAKAGLRGRI